MESELLKIINHFGVDNQITHLEKEMKELNEAMEELYVSFDYHTSLMNFIEELSDCMVLAKQLALKAGITLEEIDAIQPDKINRTIDIIDKSDPSKDKLEEYNRLRRG